MLSPKRIPLKHRKRTSVHAFLVGIVLGSARFQVLTRDRAEAIRLIERTTDPLPPSLYFTGVARRP